MKSLLKQDFNYILPQSLIAQQAISKRDNSRLLVFKNRKITHHHFYDLPQFLSKTHHLVLNDTKVIPARIFIQKDTGTWIEILLLSPIPHTTPIEQIMETMTSCTWECMIGNLKKWKKENIQKEITCNTQNIVVNFTLLNREKKWVNIEWNNSSITFASLLESLGKIPLPPYIHREKKEKNNNDIQSYQTIYAKNNGAIAAPTAGLHFTPHIIKSLKKKGILMSPVTLHVGAGTFLPVKVTHVDKHPMHQEVFHISLDSMEALTSEKKIIAVGTTSTRTLESLYWIGFMIKKKMINDIHVRDALPIFVPKTFAYQYEKETTNFSRQESFQTICRFLKKNNLTSLTAHTEIMIVPGYSFKVIEGLITNFHQSESTLIMLIAAWVGNSWKKIYQEAIQKEYQFLSYGDSSLLFNSNDLV